MTAGNNLILGDFCMWIEHYCFDLPMLRAGKNFKYDCMVLYALMFHLWFIIVYVIYQICAVTIAAMSEYVFFFFFFFFFDSCLTSR